MVDTTFRLVQPSLRAADETEEVYAVGVAEVTIPAGGRDTVFEDTYPPLRAYDLGDGTYALAVVVQ